MQNSTHLLLDRKIEFVLIFNFFKKDTLRIEKTHIVNVEYLIRQGICAACGLLKPVEIFFFVLLVRLVTNFFVVQNVRA